ncbi:MAG TPA: hypothetical protein VMS96_11900 [Terriglobales bacterium]|nr:hypothetical protein [Terriglobales bacterium]
MVAVRPILAADESALSKEQIEQFLLNAEVVAHKQSKKGITLPFRLTLSDGKMTHDASFQSIDEHKHEQKLSSGQTEYNFVDSYKYNIAAFRLAELLGLDDMVPVYVERKWEGRRGSISWWLPVQMDEGERKKRHVSPPDPDAWNKQMYKVRVLDQLVYDVDANLTNVLITPDWKLWRVDFSRAFRLYGQLQEARDLVRCDRQLLAKLKALDGNELAARTEGFLTKPELKAVLARRDKIVAHFQKLIAEKGEDAVLY